MGVTVTTTAKLGQFFAPVGATIASGILSEEYNATAQTFTNPLVTYANSSEDLFNTQGQRWLSLGADADGVRNVATPRASSVPSTTEWEIRFTGLALDIIFIGTSYYDSQVYVEVGGRLQKVRSLPLTGTVPGVMHRRLVFTNPFDGLIRFVLGGGTFVGIRSEQSAIIRPAPDRPYGILDGDKFADSGTKQASGSSYIVGSLADQLFERSGIVFGRRAQTDTGFFHNGNAAVSDDTEAPNGSSRWFSQERKDHLLEDFGEFPLLYLLIGSLADANDTASMAERALECYEWVRDQDPYLTLVHVSPLPYTGAGAAGAPTGPPTAGNPHDLNRAAQQAAIGKVARARYVNAYGPTQPFWTGAGSNGTPTSSPQAALIGVDTNSMNYLGQQFLAARILAEISQYPVYIRRARGTA